MNWDLRAFETPNDQASRLGQQVTALGPDGWQDSSIGNETEFTTRPKRFKVDSNQRIPFLPMELLPDDRLYTSQYEFRTPETISSGVFFQDGDLLLAKITPCLENGKQAIATGIPGGWGFATTEVFPIKVKPDRLDPEFLAFFFRLQDVRHTLASKMQGATGRQRLPREALEAYPIRVPPLPEQKAIAHVLRTVQQAKEATEKVIAVTRQLKQSMMKHLFTYGPVPFDQADKVELKETELGRLPAHWELVRLGEIARIGNGSTPKRTNESYWKNGTIPWLTSAKVYDGIVRQADEFVTETAKRECHLPMVSKGSLIVAITGQGKTLGNAALLGLDTCVSQHLAYIQLTVDNVLPEYLLRFLQQRYWHFRQVSNAGGSTKGALTCGYLKGYLCPVPPKIQQTEIACMVGAIEAKVGVEQQRLNALEGVYRSLLHYLMTGKVRVYDGAEHKVAEAI